MVKEYEQIDTVSINSTLQKWWLFALVLFSTTLLGGFGLLVALALGVANPRIEGTLRQNYDDLRNWPQTTLSPDLQRYAVPVTLSASPLTLQASASNHGTADSAWGFWLQADDHTELFILINNEGYVSVNLEPQPDWRGFLHIRHNQTNQLTLTIAADGTAQVRINDEIAWEADWALSSAIQWGVLVYRQPQIDWGELTTFSN